MKTKMNFVSMVSIFIAGLSLVNTCLAGCSKDTTAIVDNLPAIKGYPIAGTNQIKFYNSLIEISAPTSGTAFYGQNANYPGNSPDYVNNCDGTITDNGYGTISDNATGLMWKQNDYGEGMNWQDALKYADTAQFAGYSDWHLPDAKELQSIVDYTRSPSTSNSAAIDPLFSCTKITNEAGNEDYPFYWSSTTHVSWSSQMGCSAAAYVSFGRAMGYMTDPMNLSIGGWIDVHGAGCQRSDPKTGNASDFPQGRGPQGDAIRILNYVRLVRNIQ
ncbi:MAG: DUF1566 domain-containing protein [Bacteroidia bacterium]|nr:DUF1566 domain-containing protein [Bacteroidia bacterium]